MTTLAPEEVRRVAQRFEFTVTTPKPARKQRPSIHVRSCAITMDQVRHEVARIIPILASVLNASPDLILTHDRSRATCDARVMACAWLRNQGAAFPMISEAMGLYDHTVVWRAVRRWERHMEHDANFRASWERFLSALDT